MTGVFITGTDTGVGKTYVTAYLARYCVTQGYRVAALKPIASGAQYVDGRLQNDDALQLQHAVNPSLSYDEVNPICFAEPIAPHLAAAHVGSRIDIAQLARQIQAVAVRVQVTLVEGVGGWLVPLSGSTSVADLARSLNYPVIMLVGMRLGCLNHALLTADSIRQHGCQLLGWIANAIDPGFAYCEENIVALQERLASPLIASFPHKNYSLTTHENIDLARFMQCLKVD